MKKILFFSLAVAGMLTSCSSDESVNLDSTENPVGSGVPIQLGFGGTVSTATRGTGTVGGFTDDAASNVWHNQRVNVYMLKKDSIKLATFEKSTTAIYDNQVFETPGRAFANTTAPVGPRNSGLARPVDDIVKYYPLTGNFDFYAYRLDGANATAPTLVENDSLSVDFTIDGSQDIMVGKAYPDAADTLKLQDANNADADRAFSAFSARHGVQPNIIFNHLLSRLQFQVIPQSANTVDPIGGILIDSIKVISQNKGTLTIAKMGDVKGNTQKINWQSGMDSLSLMQRDSAWHYQSTAKPTLPGRPGGTNIDSLNLVKLDSVDLRGLHDYNSYKELDQTVEANKVDTVGVGEALLVAPGTSYKISIFMHQWTLKEYTPGQVPSNLKLTRYELPSTLTVTTSDGFEAGKSYMVTIKVWGLEDIRINTTLTGWQHGEPVGIQPEEDL